jgi:TolB-like protein/DNA-binding winged helix-turn-helix (wHTH) protein/tetratricopeptide (TPR) repeat protein
MAPGQESAHQYGYRFGAFELELASGELKRRGLKVRLRGRPVEILTILIERGRDIVTREELRGRLWTSDTFVDFDHGLNSAMNKLREALGDTAENPRFIETIPRRGYRFIAPVEPLLREPSATPAAPVAAQVPAASVPVVPEGAAPRRGVKSWMAAGAVLLVAAGLVAGWRWSSARTPNKTMLVVLPFENLSPADRDDVFSDGFTDELIAQLGALDPAKLGVIARTTSMQYKHSTKDAMQIGRELNVGYLLEGGVRRDQQRARITVRLVEVGSQTQLWSDAYERDLADVLMLQHDVAVRVSQTLAGGVLSPVLEHAAEAPAPKFAAYELVLRARALRQQATESGNRACLSLFQEAVDADPEYAPAYAGIADCSRLLGWPGWEVGPPDEFLQRAREAADHALTLDPLLAEGYAVRAMVRFGYDWDLAGADADLQRALTLNPSFARAHQYRSAVLLTMGHPDAAVDAARRAFELDPLSPTESTTLAIRLYYAGRYADAIAQFMTTLRAHPEFGVAHWGLGETYREIGRTDDAIQELRKAVDRSGGTDYMRAWLAHALAAGDHREEAEAIRRDLTERARSHYVAPFLFAVMASGFAEREATLQWLQKTSEARSGWMPFVPVEPELRWLRGDPRFEALVKRIRPRTAQAASR